jgi:hypothetical protein
MPKYTVRKVRESDGGYVYIVTYKGKHVGRTGTRYDADNLGTYAMEMDRRGLKNRYEK